MTQSASQLIYVTNLKPCISLVYSDNGYIRTTNIRKDSLIRDVKNKIELFYKEYSEKLCSKPQDIYNAFSLVVLDIYLVTNNENLYQLTIELDKNYEKLSDHLQKKEYRQILEMHKVTAKLIKSVSEKYRAIESYKEVIEFKDRIFTFFQMG